MERGEEGKKKGKNGSTKREKGKKWTEVRKEK